MILILLAALLPLGANAAPPALTVVVSVDQMRADYLTRFAGEFRGGFARLARDGAVFTQARHAHVPTETAPGHAALLTGCFPSQHGIVGNEWWDKKESRAVYAAEDAGRGRGPAHLECPTLGDALKAASPSSRVVSVSGKDRAAILMGGRMADLVLWYDKGSGRFISSGFYGPPPDWVLKWNGALRLPPAERESVGRTRRLDDMTLSLAERAIDADRLGSRGVPDLLTIGLSATDIIGHAFGPDSPQIRAQLLALDESLGAFIEGLDRRFGRGGYALALAADHGVTPLPETNRDPGALRLVEAGLARDLEAALRLKFGAPPPPSPRWVLDLHSPNVYLDSAAAGGGAAEILAEAQRWLSRHPAVAHVYSAAELEGEPDGPYAEIFKRSFRPGRSGDLMILFKRGVVLAAGPAGTVHGLPYDDDARIPLVFLGDGIKPGRSDERVLATDLAPTLARRLGVALAPRAPSRVLDEALSQGAPAAP